MVPTSLVSERYSAYQPSFTRRYSLLKKKEGNWGRNVSRNCFLDGYRGRARQLLGTSRNYDHDGNGKKAISLINEQNNNSARVSRFFVHFFAVPAQLQHEIAKF